MAEDVRLGTEPRSVGAGRAATDRRQREGAAFHPNRARVRLRVFRRGLRAAGPRTQAGVFRRSVPVDLGEREIVLSDGENVLGRDPEAVVWIDRDSVSRRHARIVVSGDSATLEDLGSKNGTYIAGGRIAKPVSISNGQEIRIGSASLVFRVFRASGTTAS